jgi:hypothetical protein
MYERLDSVGIFNKMCFISITLKIKKSIVIATYNSGKHEEKAHQY